MRVTEITDAASNQRVMIDDWVVWGQFLDPNVTKIPLKSSHQGLFDWCNKNMVVPV